MKKQFFYVVFMLLFAGLTIGLTASSSVSTAGDGSVRVLVEFAPGQKGAVANALSRAGGVTHYEFDSLNVIAVSLPEAALSGLARNPNVVSIEEDAPRRLYGANVDVPALALAMAASGPQVTPYGVTAVQAPDVWAEGIDGTGRKVCIIDSGYYSAHEDLPGGVSGFSQIPDQPWAEDGNSHGTHVAGTIAGVDNDIGVVGVAPGVSLFIVKIFNNDGVWTNTSDLMDASQRCADNDADVISMSLGGSQKVRAEEAHFANLDSQGVLSVAAAGNDGNTRRSYPASYASVVSVAAVDSNNNIADFSQQNSAVELAAPGVGVLSTTSYLSDNSVTVDGTTYSAGHIEFSATITATGSLVSGGLCDSMGNWGGQVVLCERGVISFYEKVMNVQNSGGAAALIYNNEPGGFAGTLGDGSSSNIVALSLSQEDGQYLFANALGQSANVSAEFKAPASGYEYYDGTSMATPHVSAVAALVWSGNPGWTNQQIRDALTATALDLGAAGLDNAYGYGLVQAKAALDYLGGGTPPTPTPEPSPTPTATPTDPPSGGTMHVSSIEMSYSTKGPNNDILTTVTVVDANGAPVSSATVSLSMTLPDGTASGSAATNGSGQVTFSLKYRGSGTFTSTVTGVSLSGYAYDTASNVETSESIVVP